MNITYKGRNYRQTKAGQWVTFAATKWHNVTNLVILHKLEARMNHARQRTQRTSYR